MSGIVLGKRLSGFAVFLTRSENVTSEYEPETLGNIRALLERFPPPPSDEINLPSSNPSQSSFSLKSMSANFGSFLSRARGKEKT